MIEVQKYMEEILEEYTEADLGEMYGLVCMTEDMKLPKVQMDTQHAKDILMMAIEYVRLVK